MSGSLATEPHEDPTGIQGAIDRHRDIAKYLVGIFAAIGGLLLAGTQVSSLGELSFADDRARLLVAGGALITALLAVILILGQAVSVLRPVEMSLTDVVEDPARRAEADRRPTLLGGVRSVEDLEMVDARDLDPKVREEWLAIVADVVADASFRESKQRFERAWRSMTVFAGIAAVAITVFAYAANPPEDEQAAKAVVRPAPQAVRFSLTDEGRRTLAEALGSRCVTHPIDALAVGGSPAAPVVVTLPRGDCASAQFVLSAAIGVPIATSVAR